MAKQNAAKEYLIGMGCDVKLANFLSKRHVVEELEKLSYVDAINLALSDYAAKEIQSRRPPIPPDILVSVLESNLRVCCVCYDEHRSVIVHHVIPYAKEKKHEEKNLAVLCVQCHSDAHTEHDMEQNLDAAKLILHKKSWEAAVKHRKQWTLQKPETWNAETRWDWINMARLQTTVMSLAKELDVPTSDARVNLENIKLLDKNGYDFKLSYEKKEPAYFTDVGEYQINLTAYITQLVEWVASNYAVFDATEYCENPVLLYNFLRAGMYFCAQMDFRVDRSNPAELIGIGQKGGVIVRFVFNDWNCMTSTSRSIKNNKINLIIFGSIRSVDQNPYNKDVIIEISPLGLSTKFDPNDYFGPGYFQ